MKTSKKMTALLLAAGMIASMSGGAMTAQAEGQSVTINIESEPPSLNSLLASDLVSFNVLRHVEVGLTSLDDNNEVVPGIAESWETNEEQTVYTFHLRDASWSDGTAVTANDFAYAWKTLLTPDTAALYAYLLFPIQNAAAINAGEAEPDSLGVKVIDDKTLEVTLNEATTYFPFLCSQISYLPVNQAFYEGVLAAGGQYGDSPENLLYNGPFVMTSWNHESDIVLEKNEGYFAADEVQLDTVNCKMIANDSTAYNMFVGGELDMIDLGTGDQVALAQANGYEVLTKSNGAVEYLEFNTADPVLSNVNIRKALADSIDRGTLINTILKDSSTVALSFTNPDISDYDGACFKDKVGDIHEDNASDSAKESLAKGMEELGLTELPAVSITIDDRDSAKVKAAALQEYWKQNLGLEVEVLSMPYKSKLDAVNNKDFQICISAWGPDYNDPMTFLELFITDSGMSNSGWSSEAYDELIAQAKKELDPAKRSELLIEAEKMVLGEYSITPLDFQNQSYAVSQRLKGVFRSSFQDVDLIHAYVEE